MKLDERIDELEAKGKPIERGLRGLIAKAPNWAVGIAFLAGVVLTYGVHRAFG